MAPKSSWHRAGQRMSAQLVFKKQTNLRVISLSFPIADW